ncbi:MAG: hypothetical protein ACXVJ7_03520 [Acidimicrobiia bacterium]
MSVISTISPAHRSWTSIRTRLLRAVAVAVLSLTFVGSLTATGASAATRAPGSVYPGHYGCSNSSSYHWVNQHWPNITSRNGGVESVYFAFVVQQWTGSTWVNTWTSPWYAGRSNPDGWLAWPTNLAYPMYTYFIFMNGNQVPQGVNGGPVVTVPGGHYYRTYESYFWGSNGQQVSTVSAVGPSNGPLSSSQPQYCWVP